MSATSNFSIIGNLTKDVEIKKTQNGKVYAYVSLAINSGKDKADFISALAWDKLAETIAKYCKKGDCIAISGHISSYVKDKNTIIQLVASDARFIYKAKSNNTDKAPENKDDEFNPANDTFSSPDIFAPM
jgi:single-strand DNA-binding protein